METSAKLYSLNYSNVKTYLFALLFIAGNIALPQLCISYLMVVLPCCPFIFSR